MADYPALKAALDAPDLAGLADADAAAALNAPVAGPPRRVPIAEVERIALQRGRTVPIRRAAESPEHPARDAAQAALDLLAARSDDVDATAPAFAAVLDALVAAGLVSGQDRADILALASTTTSRALASFGLPVTAADVAHARSL